MATGWLKGTIKEVPSGDTLVIVGAAKVGVPPEKRITLSSLVAPKIGKRDGSVRDEPFAWESREFLRKKCIGQACVFKIDYVVEQIGNREFGSVFLNQQDNVALAVVSNGWAKLRSQGTQQSPYLEQLKRAEEDAQARGVGQWTKDPDVIRASVRTVIPDDAFDPRAFFAASGKGKPVPGIVDAVLNGSTLKVCTVPEYQYITVQVAGVKCPAMGKRAVAAEPSATNGEPAVVTAATALASAPATQPEPFAREAKYFTETKALNREVRVVVEGVDQYDNLFGQVLYPEGDQAVNLGEQLLQNALAKVFEPPMVMGILTGGPKLRELERAAKAAKRNIWQGYVPTNTGQVKLSDDFRGKVVEVVSGDCVVVKDATSGQERRVNFSSLMAPRMGTRERQPDDWAVEAKEFLRKKLIGQEVHVKMEYTRKIQAATATDAALAAGEPERVMSFGNVELVEAGGKGGAAAGDEPVNASEMVVARGFARVVRHHSDEERSSVYEKLLELAEAAIAAKRGIHSNKAAPVNRVNDVSLPGNAARAKQYLPFFQRAGRMNAVVEYVLSGHRFKVQIPKEGSVIAFALGGVRAPSRAMPAQGGRPAVKGEPFADEALAYARELAMQRDVEIEVETMDRGGTFLGSLTVPGPGGKPANMGVLLLRAGLAKLHPNFDPDRVPGGRELAAAEAAARDARLKVWEKWSPEDDSAGAAGDAGADADAAGPSSSTGAAEAVPVVVTDVPDAGEFYLQFSKEPRVGWITDQISGLSITDGPVFHPELQAGGLCLGQFSLDQQWYRAFIERVNRTEPRYECYFIDYGNREKLESRRVRPIDAALAAVPPQAHPATLAYVKVPEPGSDYAAEATAYLGQLLGGGRELQAAVVRRERPAAGKDKHPRNTLSRLHVVLSEPGAPTTINQEMLIAGLARLPRRVDPASREAVSKLAEFEEEARKGHRGMFQYGDPGDSDDEKPLAPPPRKR